MATKTKTSKTSATKTKKKQETPIESASIEAIQEIASAAWTTHFTKQHNENWMLQQIAQNNPGLVYYWNPTNIGIKLKKAAVDVNKILENMGFQERNHKTWKLTEKGEKYAVLRPFEVKNEGAEYPVHGLQILWSIDVIPLIRAWLKGPAKPPTPAFSADMDEQQLLDQLLEVTEKTLTSDEITSSLFVDMELEQAKTLAARLYGKLRQHWKAVACYAQPRKKGCTIQVKALKPHGTEVPKLATPAATKDAKTLTPAAGMSAQQLVDELLKVVEKTLTDDFSVPLHVDVELEKAQELATSLHNGLCKHWKLVTCFARARKQGCTIQIKVQGPKVQAA